MRYQHLLLAVVLPLAGCESLVWKGNPFQDQKQGTTAASLGELESGYTYIPIDPLPVWTVSGSNCTSSTVPVDLLEALPDNAVRMLVEKFDVSGGISYGVAKAGAKGESYRVTIDYINADTVNVPVWIGKYARTKTKGEVEPIDPFVGLPEQYIPGSETFNISRTKPEGDVNRPFVNIPIYVGVGLRISASVNVVGSSANISGIGVIGAEAEAERLRGSLVVQTLGVNGKSVAAALPIQSELNRTTAQNAIVAVGAIKALLYADETVKAPRIVGLYLPFPGGKPLVNALISELSRDVRLKWERPCKAKTESALK